MLSLRSRLQCDFWSQGDAHGAALHRSLTTWDLLAASSAGNCFTRRWGDVSHGIVAEAIGVGSTVGTGVFSITSQVAAQQVGGGGGVQPG